MLGVARAVALERGAGAVMAPAVELGHEPVIGPVAVDETASDDDVGAWRRQPVPPAQQDHRGLEVAAGMGRLLGDQFGEEPRAGAAGRDRQQFRHVEPSLASASARGRGSPGQVAARCCGP